MTTLLLARLAISAIAMTLAAMAAERALRDVGRAGRFVWALGLLATAAASIALVTGGSLPLDAPALVRAWIAPPSAAPFAGVLESTSAAAPIDPLPLVWLAASLALIGGLSVALLRQRARLRSAHVERVSGVEVIVTRALGPAVMGFLHPRIVVPDWLLERSDEERRLVVEHEAEHIASRDPLLAAIALLVVCVVPWNPFLWYQLRRLRLAIELDCDARVLRRGDARAYGRLLVDVADRLARGTPLATALAFPRNFLEWRIRMITNRRTRPVRAAALTLAASALVVAACADAGDPTAMDEEVQAATLAEAPVHFRVSVDSTGETVEYDVEAVSFEESDRRVMLRELAPPLAAHNATTGDLILKVDSARVAELGHTVVPFRATINSDGTPANIEIDEVVPADVRLRATEQMRTHQFRRSSTNPDAPIEGAIVVD